MHELSIVEALIEQVEREVSTSGHRGRVTQVDLVIGRLSGVHVDSIRFAFELLAPGTFLEQARVEIAEPRAVCCCAACGEETRIDELVAQCPACGSGCVTIQGGQELLLESIELEENGEPP